MGKKFAEKIMTYMSENRMLQPGDTVIAGVSGGADSVCLFHVLEKLQSRIGFKLCVVHVNHGIRKAAGEDEAYVKALCEASGIPFHAVFVNVPEYAKEHGIGEEEAGRILRYQAFEEEGKRLAKPNYRIAVAHNQDDQAETILFRLFRGTGPHGLVGMLPVQGRIIRPLLETSRGEIEEYLAKEGISFRTDETNEKDEYARNRIRHHILPYAREQLCANSSQNICHMAKLLREQEEHLLREELQAFEEGTRELETGIFVDKSYYERQTEYMKKRIFHRAFATLTNFAKDIGRVHVESVCELMESQVGKSLCLPEGIRASRVYEGIELCRESNKGEAQAECDALTELCIDLSREKGDYFFAGFHIFFERFDTADMPGFLNGIPKKNCEKWFDYAKIQESLLCRYRREGDYLTVTAQGGTKNLKDYMINEKIPAKERDRVLLFAQGSHIMWVVGKRISESFKVTAETKTILKITVQEEKKCQNE